MTDLLLVAALVAGAAAVAIGWPARRSYREREVRARNADRYLAWRGRADRGTSSREGMTASEQIRLWVAVGLGIVAVACLVIGLSNG